MITFKYLKIYQRYNGDGDAFVRSSTKEEKKILNYVSWKLIEELIQDISMMKKGLVSKEFAKNLEMKLQEHCDNEETIRQIKNLAEKG